ncbi:MAG: hypothetical protein WA105_06330 [Candidatus Hydromicrobium sp.]
MENVADNFSCLFSFLKIKIFTLATSVRKQGSAESLRWSFCSFEKMRGINSQAVYTRKLKTTSTLKSRFFGIFSLEKKMSSRSPGLFERSDPALIKAGSGLLLKAKD